MTAEQWHGIWALLTAPFPLTLIALTVGAMAADLWARR